MKIKPKHLIILSLISVTTAFGAESIRISGPKTARKDLVVISRGTYSPGGNGLSRSQFDLASGKITGEIKSVEMRAYIISADCSTMYMVGPEKPKGGLVILTRPMTKTGSFKKFSPLPWDLITQEGERAEFSDLWIQKTTGRLRVSGLVRGSGAHPYSLAVYEADGSANWKKIVQKVIDSNCESCGGVCGEKENLNASEYSPSEIETSRIASHDPEMGKKILAAVKNAAQTEKIPKIKLVSEENTNWMEAVAGIEEYEDISAGEVEQFPILLSPVNWFDSSGKRQSVILPDGYKGLRLSYYLGKVLITASANSKDQLIVVDSVSGKIVSQSNTLDSHVFWGCPLK